MVTKNELDTKEVTGKSMKDALHVQKTPLGLKQRQTAKNSSL